MPILERELVEPRSALGPSLPAHRPRGAVVAVSVALMAGLLAAAYSVGRSSGSRTHQSAATTVANLPTHSAVGAAPAPSAPATATPERSLVQPSSQTVSALSDHTSAGAAGAAADIMSALGTPALFDSKSAAALIEQFVAPDARAALEGLASPVGTGDAAGITAAIEANEPVIARNVIAAWRVTAYAASSATVDLWVDGLLGTPTLGHTVSTWQTMTIGLEWTDSGWRLESLASVAGPTPSESNQTPTTYGDTQTSTNGMQGWTYAIGS